MALYNGTTDNDTYDGTADDDQIYGNNGNDTLNGLAGNDTLDGGAGDDTYIFSKNTHNDVINESGSGNDQIVLSGLNRADVILQKSILPYHSELDLLITLIATGNTLTVKNQFDSNSAQWVESLKFADGTVLTGDQLNAETNKSVAGNNKTSKNSKWSVPSFSNRDTYACFTFNFSDSSSCEMP